MSLAKAVLEIADLMETTITGIQQVHPLFVYVKMLRMAVEASKSELQPPSGYVDDKGRWHSKFKEVSEEKAQKEDSVGGMIEAVGGPADNTLIPVPGGAFENAKAVVAGAVYQYRQGKLYWMEGEKVK